jgi:hypothetical protein
MSMSIHQHRDAAEARVHDVLSRHGLDPARHAADVRALLAHPVSSRLFELLERAGRGEDVTREGDERLRMCLAVLLGVCEHVEACGGGRPSPALENALEWLSIALGE